MADHTCYLGQNTDVELDVVLLTYCYFEGDAYGHT